MDENTRFLINPTGRFTIGGPLAIPGLTGRKIIVDTYGGYARHGGGAFSGKDPTKVDRSAAYAARYIAKNIVAAGLAKRCEIELAYAIGVANPVSLLVDTQGTGVISDDALAKIVKEQFDLRPAGIIDMLNLRRPIYRQTAAFGHFGRTDVDLPWERVDRAGAARGGRHLNIFSRKMALLWMVRIGSNAIFIFRKFIRAEAQFSFDFRFARGDIQRSLVGVGDKTGGVPPGFLIYRRSVASIGTCALRTPFE